MTDLLARDAFDRALADEPPLTLTLDPVLLTGRRLRRRRRIAYGATAVTSFAAVVAIAVPALTAGGAGLRAVPLHQAASSTAVPDSLTAEQRAVADAIEAASRDGLTFDFAKERWSGLGVEAAVDDGAGLGRLFVGVSTATQLLHPCADAEFGLGGSCTERVLPDGSVLSLRTAKEGDVEWTTAVLTHPDGSGVNVESANFSLTYPMAVITTEAEKRAMVKPTRAHPVYTTDELAEIVVAVDRAVSEA